MLNKYLKLRTTFTKPSEKDTEYAMEAIIRLRQTYNFTVDEVLIPKKNVSFYTTVMVNITTF